LEVCIVCMAPSQMLLQPNQLTLNATPMQTRCAPYFPETEGQFMQLPGRLSIKCVHKTQLSADLAIRQLEVCYPVGKYELERQWVSPFFFRAWAWLQWF